MTTMLRLSCVAAALLTAQATESGVERFARKKDFGALRTFLDANYWNISLTLGDESGQLFDYSSGFMTDEVVLPLASGSKWPAVTALLGALTAHNVSLDEPVSKYLDYWTTSPFDERSAVTLRMVLSMTTGMIVDSDCNLELTDCDARKALGRTAFEALAKCRNGALLPECTQRLYEALPPKPLYKPGTTFMYSSLSFQFAAAVAVKASGLNIETILNRYLLKPVAMVGCGWSNAATNPLMGGGLTCSAKMMDRFLHAMLVDDLLPVAVRKEMETVQVKPSAYSTTTAYWGPYCLGNWEECMYGQGLGRPFPAQCAAAGRHGHPGCNGYYNYVHRGQKYYFNMLPSWTCTEYNSWCGAGSKDAGGAGCPALYGWASSLRREIGGFLDDIFTEY